MASAIGTFEIDDVDVDTLKPSLEEFQESMLKFNYTAEESRLFYKYSSIIDNLILIIEEELESTKELESKKDTDDELLELEEEMKLGESEESSNNTKLMNLLESIGIISADTFVNTKKIKNNLIFILNCIESEIQSIKEGGKRSRRTQKQQKTQRQQKQQKQQRQQKTQRQQKQQRHQKTRKH
jgi:transcription initiation factor TFIID subunit TAF12